MKREFHCLQCNTHFEAEDLGHDVVCPSCGSDNVAPVEASRLKPFVRVAVLLASVGVGYGVTSALLPDQPASPDTPTTIATSSDGLSGQPGGAGAATDPTKGPAGSRPISVEVVSAPQLKGQAYSLQLTSDGAHVARYELHDEHDRVVAKSPSGHFSDVPPSTDGGAYYAYAIATDGSNSDPLPLTGFDPVTKVEKASAAKVEKLINSKRSNVQDNHDVFATRVAIHVTGLNSGDTPPQDMQAIFGKFRFEEWSSIKVEQVGYNSVGRVNSITIRPIYPND